MFNLLEVILAAPGETDRPHLELIATIIAAIAYGFILCLFLQTLTLLIINKKHVFTCTMRSVLIIYTVVMFAISTLTVIQQIADIADVMATPPSRIVKMNELFFIPFAIFGADSFMLWRSVILYQDLSPRYRVFLHGLLILISIGSIGSGILYYLGPHISIVALKSPFTPSIITISITTSLNFILTAIIAGRLLYHQEIMRRILGNEYRSPYSRVIVMLVESCSLIVVTGLTFLILVAVGHMKRYNGCVIPYCLLPHVCVLAPLLIVYQVARGRAITSTTMRLSRLVTPSMSGSMCEGASHLEPIRFNRPAISTFNRNMIGAFDTDELDHTRQEKADNAQPSEIRGDPFPISPV